MNDDDYQSDCPRCHAFIAIDDGYEPTKFCHHCAQDLLLELTEAATGLRAHVATLPDETQRLLNITGWMTELRKALTSAGNP